MASEECYRKQAEEWLKRMTQPLLYEELALARRREVMASWSFGVVEIDGHPVVMDGMDAMYVRAQQRGDTKLMRMLEHRAEKHNGGPCFCDEGEK
jgi:hypothetical protein